jgi:hypothetical protein
MDVLRFLGVDFYIVHFPICLTHMLRLMYMYSVILNCIVLCVCVCVCVCVYTIFFIVTWT